MKKIILCICCLFILTGCNATYDLTIDGNIEESLVILDNYENYGDEQELYDNLELIDLNVLNSMPLSNSESKDFYKVEKINDEIKFGIKFKGNFKENFYNSNIIKNSCGIVEIDKDLTRTKINIGDFKVFDAHENLSKITINIKSKYKLRKNNADSVKGNVYTWVITRNNYKNKNINISFYENNLSETDDSMILFSIVIFSLVIIALVVFLIFKIKYKKNNSL